jgi:hypothetical protein
MLIWLYEKLKIYTTCSLAVYIQVKKNLELIRIIMSSNNMFFKNQE